MELLAKSRKEQRANLNLESLHAESMEWRNEIDFWRDEMAFFYKLLQKEETRETFPAKDLAAVENQ